MNDPRSIARRVRVKGPRVFLDYGSLETPEFQRQSREFAAALRGAGKPVELIFADGCNHFEIAETLANPTAMSGRAVLAAKLDLTEHGIMKITAVKSYTVHPGWRKNLIFVKVETDAGIHGWGEAYSQYDRDPAVTAQLDALGPLRRWAAARSTSSISRRSPSTTTRSAAARSSSSARSSRHRAGDVGHRRQGVQAAGLQPARRALPRQDPRLRERLELRHEGARRLRARGREGGRAGLHRAQARSAARAVAHLDPEGARRARGARGEGGARRRRSRRRHPDRPAPPARADARDPARQAARRGRSLLDGRAVPGGVSRTSWRRSAARSGCRS